MVDSGTELSRLFDERDVARERFFAHRDPGNLKFAQKRAFRFKSMAYLLLLKSAQMELEAELEMQSLLAQEAAHV